MSIVDLFAGPGGWDIGARELGLEPLGIEWDDAACATREAAGLRTLQADVAELDPLDFPCDGLIASPPCQAFSMAGKGEGRAAVHHVMACVRDLAEGRDTRAEHNAACSDDRTMLVVEPLRWALALRPAWLAFEQVPPVMPLWRAFADVLRHAGYNVWTGVLEAERYGVPQTRERAILMARLDGPVHPPAATHHRFVPGQPRPEASNDLFGGGLLPWVSMAEALGWGMTSRPGLTVAAGTKSGGADSAMVGGTGARETLTRERDEGRWVLNPDAGRGAGMVERHGDRERVELDVPAPTVTTHVRDWRLEQATPRRGDAKRSADEPAPTITGGGSSQQREWVYRAGVQPNSCERQLDAPAPTIGGFGHDAASHGWRLRSGQTVNGGPHAERELDEPSVTITSRTDLNHWTHDRPATALAGDRRVFPPGGHKANDDRDNSRMVGRSQDAIRVSVQEAAVLQSFPADHPWQGSKTAQYRQIGDAVPPMLARAVLEVLVHAST